jgi:glycerate-2-kinase
VADSSTPQQAIEILEKFGVVSAGIAKAAINYLRRLAERADVTSQVPGSVHNLIIGNNATAVDAAGCEAERLGYSHAMMAGRTLEGFAEHVGEHLARMSLQMRSGSGPDCLITGGEPVVSLVPADRRGIGGRNQQLVLAALRHLLASQSDLSAEDGLAGIALMAGGTDGEDGPTDAAGAFVDQLVGKQLDAKWLDPADFLERNDAYSFFRAFDALIKTGPTHTNVCDLRVVTIGR